LEIQDYTGLKKHPREPRNAQVHKSQRLLAWFISSNLFSAVASKTFPACKRI